MRSLPVLAAALVSVSCAARPFRVVPATPDYLLRSPNAVDTPFSDVQRLYYHSDAGGMSLGPLTRLRIENAYYETGATKHGVDRYLGTELAIYTIQPRGLTLTAAAQRLPNAPADQLPVEQLIRPAALRFRHYSLFLQIALSKTSDRRGAVLLGAASAAELARLSSQMAADPEAVCNDISPHCTVFPEACSVAVEIAITVNGVRRNVVWATRVASLFAPARPPALADLRITRRTGGREIPVLVDPADPKVLALPLLPGDRIAWVTK